SGTAETGTARAGGAGAGARTGPGLLTVEAAPAGDVTLVTLSASGGGPVDWSASADAPWLRLSRAHGTLRPGESATITVAVDRSREPAGPWTARIAIAPARAVITLHGHGAHAPARPQPPETRAPEPSGPPAAGEPSGSPEPTEPTEPAPPEPSAHPG
ncbi:BACON domain-containing protein, partial [Streptomyces sp. URMC 125]|uniref:BACON domain-containing protein n=1 Tax=Streptomyces sp. URMC 125 TaxID=3423419 RepID=UPI003F1AB2AE